MDYQAVSDMLFKAWDEIFQEMESFSHPIDRDGLVRYFNLNDALNKVSQANKAVIKLIPRNK